MNSEDADQTAQCAVLSDSSLSVLAKSHIFARHGININIDTCCGEFIAKKIKTKTNDLTLLIFCESYNIVSHFDA